jgi:hypothetical protein
MDSNPAASLAISMQTSEGERLMRRNWLLVAKPSGASGFNFFQGRCCGGTFRSKPMPIAPMMSAKIRMKRDGFHIAL